MFNLIKDIIANNLNSKPAYLRWLERDLADCDSILELGCGSDSPLLKIGLGHKTHAVDIWEPYVTRHQRLVDYETCTVANILTMNYPEKFVDAVVMCDVLEHLERKDVYYNELFRKMEQCARKKVILFVPNGFMENDEVDGDPYQRHVSAWCPNDYRREGYKIRGTTGFHWLYGKAGIVRWRPRVFMEYLGQLSQLLIYHFPKYAWHSYAVKEL